MKCSTYIFQYLKYENLYYIGIRKRKKIIKYSDCIIYRSNQEALQKINSINKTRVNLKHNEQLYSNQYLDCIKQKKVAKRIYYKDDNNILNTLNLDNIKQHDTPHIIQNSSKNQEYVEKDSKKKVLSENIENKLNEVNKKDINQVKILKLFSIDEIKSGIPRRHSKRQKGITHDNAENNDNCEHYENNPADDCANVTNVGGHANKTILKKNDNTQNSIKRSNFIEDKNGNNIINGCNSIDSKKKNNKKNYNQCVIPNKLFRKKYICIENNIKLVDSYINKKYHIEVKKRDNNKNEKTNSNSNDNNVFNYSEERSIQLLDEVKERENFQNKEQHNDKKKNNNNNELQISSVDYENKNRIIKKIYKASINHVRDENLWKKYVQNVFTISAYLDASEIVILFWCFSKIGYRDNRLINLLSSIILKKINELSCCALSLLLNSYKKLEIKKYDTIELLTNQFCFHVSNWKFQDIAL
ncbi:RAP protein, putative, partial [Plasmodium ovale curtisi]